MGEEIQRKTRAIVKHRGCCIEQQTLVMKALPSALDDDPSSMHMGRRRSMTVRVMPIQYGAVVLGDGYDDYRWAVEQVRAIEAAAVMKKEVAELRKEVAELKREVQRYKEKLDDLQHKDKGKMIASMVADVLPVPDTIKNTIRRLIDLV